MFDICIVIRCSMWLNYKKGGNVEFVVFTFFCAIVNDTCRQIKRLRPFVWV